MNVLTPGHRYLLSHHENPAERNNPGEIIQFIQKEPIEPGSATLKTVSNGTTNEEVLRMLIDRMNFLQKAFPCRENAIVITKLEESLMWMEKRTADRVNRQVEGKQLA